MNCQKNFDVKTIGCEELDYEEDDVVKKRCLEKGGEEDLEDGEISDVNEGDLESYKCCLFQRGQCRFGEKCALMHVTDKGLYRMIDSPPLFSSTLENVHPAVRSPNLDISKRHDRTMTDWDRALQKAKESVRRWDIKGKKTYEPVVDTIDSDIEQLPLKSSKTRCFKSSDRKVWPRYSFLSGSYSVAPELKSAQNKNEWQREVRWYGRWRRSPSRRKNSTSKSNTSSSSLNCDSRSSRLRKRSRLSPSKRQRRKMCVGNQSKAISRRFSSSSSSPASAHRSRKRELKRQSARRKRNSQSVENKTSRNSEAHNCTKKGYPTFSFSSDLQSHGVHSWKPKKIRPTLTDDHSKEAKKVGPSTPSDDRTPKQIRPALNDVHSRTTEESRPTPMDDRSREQQEIGSCTPGDACSRTPQKIRPFTPPMESCSDMSISPFTDSSLSDLFDPNKKRDLLDSPCRHEASRLCMFMPRKTCQTEIHSTFPPQETLSAVPNLPAMKSNSKRMIENKATPSSQVSKRNLSALEGDLLKFHKKRLPGDSQLTSSKAVHEGAETKKEALLKSGEMLSRREMLLRQLEAVDAAIQRKQKASNEN